MVLPYTSAKALATAEQELVFALWADADKPLAKVKRPNYRIVKKFISYGHKKCWRLVVERRILWIFWMELPIDFEPTRPDSAKEYITQYKQSIKKELHDNVVIHEEV